MSFPCCCGRRRPAGFLLWAGCTGSTDVLAMLDAVVRDLVRDVVLDMGPLGGCA
jgi:hypothetical protein